MLDGTMRPFKRVVFLVIVIALLYALYNISTNWQKWRHQLTKQVFQDGDQTYAVGTLIISDNEHKLYGRVQSNYIRQNVTYMESVSQKKDKWFNFLAGTIFTKAPITARKLFNSYSLIKNKNDTQNVFQSNSSTDHKLKTLSNLSILKQTPHQKDIRNSGDPNALKDLLRKRASIAPARNFSAGREHVHQTKIAKGQVTTSSWTPAPKNESLKIVLFTSYRSGSSFVGEILQSHSEVFYMFEPLWFLHMPDENMSPMMEQHSSVMDNIQENLATTLSLLLDCSLNSLLKQSVNMFPGQLNDERRSVWLERCFPGQPYWNITLLEASCRARKHVVIKIIRGELLSNIAPLLKQKNVVVLYLIRDPRAITISAVDADMHVLNQDISKEDYQKASLFYTWQSCNRLRKNLNYLQTTMHQRLKLLRYEDFAYNPLYMSDKLYSFLGLKFSVLQRHYLVMKSHSKRQSANDPFGTNRNSATTAEKWLKRVQYRMIEILQYKCSKVLPDAGYSVVGPQMTMSNLTSVLMKLPHTLPGL